VLFTLAASPPLKSFYLHMKTIIGANAKWINASLRLQSISKEKVNEIYSSLSEEDDFRKAIDKGLDALKENIFAGEIIKKKQIPKYYIKKFGVNNLYRLKLDRKRRCCYTIVADHEGLKVIVLEVFPDHKSYNRRFGYRKG
jgi:hypothetical protein